VVDYWATWCGPCKLIGPHFAKLESKYPGVKFAKVDVEEQEVRVVWFCFVFCVWWFWVVFRGLRTAGLFW
jgi:thiol-disulfide isomerase/thioredoxin